MTYRMQIQATGIEGLRPAEMHRIYRVSTKAIGKRWQVRLLPKHVTAKGAREYGYGARQGEPGSGEPYKGSYTERKFQRFGHKKPLWYTGQAFREAKRGNITARASKRGASVSISTSRKYNLRNPKSKTYPAEEIRRVSRRENRNLSGHLARNIDQGLTKAGKAAGTRAVIGR